MHVHTLTLNSGLSISGGFHFPLYAGLAIIGGVHSPHPTSSHTGLTEEREEGGGKDKEGERKGGMKGKEEERKGFS